MMGTATSRTQNISRHRTEMLPRIILSMMIASRSLFLTISLPGCACHHTPVYLTDSCRCRNQRDCRLCCCFGRDCASDIIPGYIN